MGLFEKTVKATKSDVRGLQLVLAQIHIGKVMFDQGRMDKVHAALFAAGQMLEPMLHRFEDEVGMPHDGLFAGLPSEALVAGLVAAEAALSVPPSSEKPEPETWWEALKQVRDSGEMAGQADG